MNSDNQSLVYHPCIRLLHFSRTNRQQVEFLNKFLGNMSRFGIIALMSQLLPLFFHSRMLLLRPYFVSQHTNLIRGVFRTLSKMKCFAKIVNGWKLLTIFAKLFILDVWQGSEYASANNNMCITITTNSVISGMHFFFSCLFFLFCFFC